MPIKKLNVTAETLDKKVEGRHPLLSIAGSDHVAAYDYIRLYDGCTAADVKQAINVHHQRVSDLVKQGLVRRGERSGRHYALHVVPENLAQPGRVCVEVTVSIYRDATGPLSAHVHINGQPPDEAPRGEKLAQRVCRFYLPRSSESLQTVAQDLDVIDGEYVVIDDK